MLNLLWLYILYFVIADIRLMNTSSKITYIILKLYRNMKKLSVSLGILLLVGLTLVVSPYFLELSYQEDDEDDKNKS
jgi:hypothetical protein